MLHRPCGVKQITHRGFTLIELLIIVSIVGLLVMLLLPAVQSAREASRRAQCQNNLKQIGLALQNYATSHRSFPLNWDSNLATPDPRAGGIARPFGAYTRLLPYLDQSTLYAAMNFSEQLYPNDLNDQISSFPMNITVASTRLSMLLCPSDTIPSTFQVGCNYRANYGIGPAPATTRETYDSGNGFYTFFAILEPASFTDGLSHTVAYSERLIGSAGETGNSTSRDTANMSNVSGVCSVSSADFALDCSRIAATKKFPVSVYTGANWFFGDFEFSSYCHAQEPNGRIPDALTDQHGGIVTARSNHLGGVNCLMGDGAVRFVSGRINRITWRALGTRNGDELVE